MTWLYPCTSNVIFVKIQLFDFVCKQEQFLCRGCNLITSILASVEDCIRRVLGQEFVNKSRDNKLPSEVHNSCAHLDRH